MKMNGIKVILRFRVVTLLHFVAVCRSYRSCLTCSRRTKIENNIEWRKKINSNNKAIYNFVLFLQTKNEVTVQYILHLKLTHRTNGFKGLGIAENSKGQNIYYPT